MILKPLQKIHLSPKLPGDKSLSHRALIFGALANGVSQFQNLSQAEDVLSTKKVLSQLGVEISVKDEIFYVHGCDKKLKAPNKALDCGNAGTLMRLMMGVLAGQKFSSTLTGDESLSGRPMKRVSEPLSQMGAQISLRDHQFAPVQISLGNLTGKNIELKVASAQVKSALLLAGLFCDQETILTGKIHSRDHTERLLKYFGVDIEATDQQITLKPRQKLISQNYFVPNDISPAAFWIAAGVLAADSDITLENVGLNSSRMGFVNVLKRAGAKIDIQIKEESPEPIGQIRVRSSVLKPFVVESYEMASLIDEVPLLALIATQIEGTSQILGAEELRFKESDRLVATQVALNNLSGLVEISENDLKIHGGKKLTGGFVKTYKDHRIAMMACVARFCSEGEINIEEVESATISDPHFISQMESL